MSSNIKIVFAFVFVALLIALSNSIFVVQETKQAIVIQLGKVVKMLGTVVYILNCHL